MEGGPRRQETRFSVEQKLWVGLFWYFANTTGVLKLTVMFSNKKGLSTTRFSTSQWNPEVVISVFLLTDLEEISLWWANKLWSNNFGVTLNPKRTSINIAKKLRMVFFLCNENNDTWLQFTLYCTNTKFLTENLYCH